MVPLAALAVSVLVAALPAPSTTAWQTLMAQASAEDAAGHYRDALEHSNQALDMAMRMDDGFLLGRSLCWMGWTYSNMGLYQVAKTFFERAVKVGAPHGKPVLVPVWGLALQELGYAQFKLGHVEEGKANLTTTVEYARKHRILVGVSEGGAHLAEIALHQGHLVEARTLAEEAVAASKECACVAQNTARALVINARVSMAWQTEPTEKPGRAMQDVLAAVEFAKANGIPNQEAEALVLQSALTPAARFEERLELASRALEMLGGMESAGEGNAESHLGLVFLEHDDVALAKFYVDHGFALNAAKFHDADNAFVARHRSRLETLKGDDAAKWRALSQQADAATQTGAWEVALEAQTHLATSLAKGGFSLLALGWNHAARGSLEKLLAAEQPPARARQFKETHASLMTQAAQLQLDLGRPAVPSGLAQP